MTRRADEKDTPPAGLDNGQQAPQRLPPLSNSMASNPAKPLVAFLGPAASYTHQATLLVFPQETWELRPATTITDVFDQVQDGHVLRGVVPFENSSHGSVVVTLDNLADRDGRYKDISVEGEVFVDVRHCLLGFKAQREGSATIPRANSTPTAASPDFKLIKQIYSHPQAFGQCRKFISQDLKAAEIHDVSSTSRAAEIVRQNGTGASAAISSRLAAGIYGLDVLAESVQDRDDNVTRFLFIRNTQNPPLESPDSNQPSATGNDETAGTKSLVSFTVPHDSPGALADVLSCFKDCGLNLTSINSRPSLQAPFRYVFFVELGGHRYGQDGRVESALSKIRDVAERSRWLGSWETRR
ncbi:chorismate mutase/prephenate dehydratase [Ophiocordyceps sinensis CO18]|uniref:prephenate dehydratase n=1 Tax=Ophiocordyceps sinensis (strain Co18 / CGMCC 3.14243) TaxID=911162 RepID=T5AEN1_OPHSC|nr:chorismate mutase/prephenate dehydratase [Ophiocordyceps sinensis CO18]